MKTNEKVTAASALPGILKIWFARAGGSRGDLSKDKAEVYCDVIARFGPTPEEWKACVDHFTDTSGFFPDAGALRDWMLKERAKANVILAEMGALRARAKEHTPWTPAQRIESRKMLQSWADSLAPKK